jgi:HNH endonuclease
LTRQTAGTLRFEAAETAPRLAHEEDADRVVTALAGSYGGERTVSIGFGGLGSVRREPAADVVRAASTLLRPWGSDARIELRSLRRPVRRLLLASIEDAACVTVFAAARRKLVLVAGPAEHEVLESSLTPTRRKMLRLAERDGEHCVWCSTPLTFRSRVATLDHVRCRSHGGADALDNLVLACAPCNHGRANAPAERWLEICLRRGSTVDVGAVHAAIARSHRHHGRPLPALQLAA